jgi:hypothetical protein
MESSIQIQSHIGTDGVLHIEGLHQIADQDVTIILTPSSSSDRLFHTSDLEKYAAPVGREVADKRGILQAAYDSRMLSIYPVVSTALSFTPLINSLSVILKV